MRPVKKLDLFIIRNFLALLAGTFFVCLFVLMMQFTWRYIDELIGKGVTMDLFAKFFWYMAVSMVPQALPLSILLSSLIAFGNMGERLELLAMKTVGVSLIRIMRPLILIVGAIAGASFYYQNVTSPYAEFRLRTLLISMHESAPALEIPEGVFYNGIPNINIYVKKKHNETGMLYDVIIYKTDQGFNKAQIVLADSAKLDITADRNHILLQLFGGEEFENLQTGDNMSIRAYVPYDRETFGYKRLLIDFNSNFNLLDAGAIGNRPESKNMKQLVAGIDSMELHGDSLGHTTYDYISRAADLGAAPALDYVALGRGNGDILPPEAPQPVIQAADGTVVEMSDSERTARRKAEEKFAARRKKAIERAVSEFMKREPSVRARAEKINIDSIYASLPEDRKADVEARVKSLASQMATDLEWQKYDTESNDLMIRKYGIAWHEKFTLSLSCLIFFFIGAPLGSIIQKGGLGAPTVMSVIIFIIYYIISTSGMKLSKEGELQIWSGMWMSVMVLAPLGAFLTYKANNDSAVFNPEAYRRFIRRILGLRTHRNIMPKEVIVYDPDYSADSVALAALSIRCSRYVAEKNLLRMPAYFHHFFTPVDDHEVKDISEEMDRIIDDLSNSRDLRILDELNRFPIIFTTAHVSPFRSPWLNRAAGIILPVGIFLWLRMWKYRLRLLRDMKQIVSSCRKEQDNIEAFLKKGSGAAEGD